MMPLIKSSRQSAIGPNIQREESAGKPHRQAVAIALSTQREAKRHGYSAGGAVSTEGDRNVKHNERHAFMNKHAEHGHSHGSHGHKAMHHFHPEGHGEGHVGSTEAHGHAASGFVDFKKAHHDTEPSTEREVEHED